MKNKILLIFCFFIIGGIKAQTNVPSLITSNQVWDLSGSPYILNQNTYIDTGAYVLVMPGVEVKGTSYYKLMVGGEFQAIGTWDSMILLENFEIEYLTGSKSYDANSGRGAFINYCNKIGGGSGKYCIRNNSISIKVSNSNFTNSYYGIYSMSSTDTVSLISENNTFSGDKYGNGTPLYAMSARIKLFATGNLFTNSSIIYSQGEAEFKNNTFDSLKTISLYVQGNVEVSCNRFLNMQGLNIYMFYSGHLKFEKNTIDSVGYATSYPMIRISRSSTSNSTAKFTDNNFLTNTGNTYKIQISGNNPNPATTDTLDFESNFWGSTDSATIENFIGDYADNVNVYGRVNFANYLSSPYFGCSYSNPCAIAGFSYSSDYLRVSFKDESIGNNAYSVKWNFGDGKTDTTNTKNISHDYNSAGVYRVCLYVYDSMENLCDSICKNIAIYSRCEASYYFAIDSNIENYVFIVNTSKGTNSKTIYYWTFGDGTGSTDKNPEHKYSDPGKYKICLTIYDTTAKCFSTFCDSIEFDFNGMNLKILNEGDVLNVDDLELINTVSAYPNPSSGKITLSLNTANSDNLKINVISIEGRIVKTGMYQTITGLNKIELDLETLKNGLYYIEMSSENYVKTLKVILNR